jgi:hypothetical protein
LMSPSILCLYLFKHRPTQFRDCARSPSQTFFSLAHFFIETKE